MTTSQKNPNNPCQPYDGEIVISGMSGRFPEADNVAEFEEKLFSGIDMVTDDNRRWPSGIFGVPNRFGKLNHLDKFDATFFNAVSKQVKYMDPMQRLLFELTYEAIIDSGINPQTLRGSRTGVFVGTMGSDASELTSTDPDKVNGYEAIGVMIFTLANRISFSYDLRGPSFTLDTACSSSLFALNAAVRAIRSGECDGALVGGCNLCLTPLKTLRLHRLNMLSPTGKCQSFDAAGDGYARSEACVVIHIQKKDLSLRSHATILHIKTSSDGFKKEGVSFPSGQRQEQLIEEVYQEAGIDPNDVTYMEAHGTGTQAGDPQEVNAIAKVFCKNSPHPTKPPLLMGSVKSNIGHTEGASGLCSIVKVILAMRRSLLPANLHFRTPNPKIPSLLNGSIQVVTENTPWDGGLVGLNSFGVFGANCHVILRSPSPTPTPTLKISPVAMTPLPLIVPFSGRTFEAVEFGLQKIYQEDSTGLDGDLEGIALLQKICEQNIPNHPFRGYRVIQEFGNPSNDLIEIEDQSKLSSFHSKLPRPQLWLIFSGMGSQWNGMGRDMMKFSKFRESICNSAKILKKKDSTFDLLDLIENGSGEKYQNVQNVFVAIASVQIALVEMLRSLGLTFDGYLGHSVGELATAFCDGGLTAGQTVLAAHARGRAIIDSNFEKGAMAAVGLSWEEAKVKCPPNIFPACHNSVDGVTVAGPFAYVAAFVEELEKENIFAKMVDSCGQAFHSPYIQEAGPKLKKYLQEILPQNSNTPPLLRSQKWISSSISVENENSNLARRAGIQYHVNNLLSPVRFFEACAHVPPGAVVIEVAPHGLLQPVLRRSLHESCHILPLNLRNLGGNGQNVSYFLKAIGKLFNLGLNPSVANLYDPHPVQFPVSGQAPLLSTIVQWDHSSSWEVHQFDLKTITPSGDLVIKISLENPDMKFYGGHKLDDRIILPATGYLVMVWKALAQLLGHSSSFEEVPVIFENVNFHRATILSGGNEVEFVLNFLQATGQFQLREGSSVVVVSGVIRPQSSEVKENGQLFFKLPESSSSSNHLKLTKSEIYTELSLRGYSYSQLFAGIQSYDHVTKWAELDWRQNWVSFLDTMIQIHLIEKPNRFLYMPTRIEKICIDPKSFLKQFQNFENQNITVPAFYNRYNEVVQCQGVEIRGLKATTTPRRQGQQDPVLEEYIFTPYFDPDDPDDPQGSKMPLNLDLGVRFCIDVVLENTIAPLLYKYKIVELVSMATDNNEVITPMAPMVEKIFLDQPMLDCAISVFSTTQTDFHDTEIKENGRIDYYEKIENFDENFQLPPVEFHLIILHDPNLLKLSAIVSSSLQHQGFILLCGSKDSNFDDAMETLPVVLVAQKNIGDQGGRLFLFRKRAEEFKKSIPKIINIDHTNNNYDWVDEVKVAMHQENDAVTMTTETVEALPSKIFLTSTGQADHHSGIVGLTNCLRHEPGGENIRTFFVQSEENFEKEELKKFDPLTFDPKLGTIMEADLVMNIFMGKEKIWGSYRLFPLVAMTTENNSTNLVTTATATDHFYLTTLVKGDLSSLHWVKGQLDHGLENDLGNPICRVYFAALNFRDVMIASGKIPPQSIAGFDSDEKIYGVDYAGLRLSNGDRIMGCVKGCGFSSLVEPDPHLSWRVPSNWTFEEASTIPTVYGTAYYALCLRGKLKEGETILIHSAAGGVGIASIVVALSLNCTVFATVSSREKREFLKNLFPQLKDSNFATNRDTSFEDHIKISTGGKGVDVVLNSLAGEKFHASIRCLAEFGRFLEIGKVDLHQNTGIGSAVFLKGVTFHGILFDLLLKNPEEKKEVADMVAHGLKSGVIKPLPTTVFSQSETEEAFRFMSTGKHVGKIVIKIRDEDDETRRKVTNMSKLTRIITRTYFDPSKCYIIIGGLGGFGLQLASWLVERGAKKLVLVSRSGLTTGYQQLCIKNWRDHGGVHVIIPTFNVAIKQEAFQLLTECSQNLGQIGGIFNLAMVLSIDLIAKQNPDRFRSVGEPKVNGTIWLDKASRELAPNLNFFVTFSSVNSCRGSAGQANYGYANSVMERICEQRQRDGLPGLAIQWGAIGDVGVVARDFGGNDAVVLGTIPQRIHSCLQVLDNFLQQPNRPVIASYVVHKKLSNKDVTGSKLDKLGAKLVEGVAHILGIKNPASVDQTKSLEEMGMDSIMLAEVKYFAERAGDLVLSHNEISSLTFSKLKQMDEERRLKNLDSQHNDDRGEGQRSSSSGQETSQNVPEKIENLNQSAQSEVEESTFLENIENDPKTAHVTSTQIAETSLQLTPNTFSEVTPDPMENFEKFFHGSKDKFKFFINYIKEFLLLILLFLAVCLTFLPRQVTKMWYIILYGDRIKLMDRPVDAIFTIDQASANIVIRLKCSGRPNKSKILDLCQTRVLNFHTSVRLDGKVEEPIKIYQPYGQSLRYKINHTSFYPTWVWHEEFDLEKQILFDQLKSPTMDLDEEAKKIMEKYLTHPLDEDRPQWEIRIVSSAKENGKEEFFYLILAIHHSYGDALTLVNLLEHALADESLSQMTKSGYPKKEDKAGVKEENVFGHLKNILTTFLHFLNGLHQWIGHMAHLTFEEVKKCPPSPPLLSVTKRQCQWVTLDASKFRKVRSSKTGKLIPFTPLVFSCISKAYGKILRESNKKLKTVSMETPQKVIVMSPLTMRPYERLGMVNNFSMAYFCFPIHPPQRTNEVARDNQIKILEKELIDLEQISETGGHRQLLDVTWLVLSALGCLPGPILRLAHCSPKYSLIVSTMPLMVSKNLTIGGHKVVEMIGYPPILHGAQGSLACTVHAGSIIFSMAVEEEEGKNDLQNFLHHFEIELNTLVALCGGPEEKSVTQSG